MSLCCILVGPLDILPFLKDYLDSEKTYEAFLGACADVSSPIDISNEANAHLPGSFKAGPQRCALASMNSTAKSLGKEVDAALDALLEHPLVIPGAGTFGIPAKLRPTAVRALAAFSKGGVNDD